MVSTNLRHHPHHVPFQVDIESPKSVLARANIKVGVLNGSLVVMHTGGVNHKAAGPQGPQFTQSHQDK